MSGKSRFISKKNDGWSLRQKIISSVGQVVLVVLILPGILYLLSFAFSKETLEALWTSLTQIADEIPATGNILDLVRNFYTMSQTPDGYMLFFDGFLKTLGNEVMDIMMVGMCIYALSTISREFIPGIPAVAVMVGSFLGVLLTWLTKGAVFQAKLFIISGLVIMNLVVIMVLHGVNKAELVIKLFLMGFQGVIAQYSLFFTACVLYLIAEKPAGFRAICIFWIFPAIVFALMLGLDFYVQMSTEFRFFRKK